MLLELTPNYIDINNSLNNDTLKYLLCYPDPDSNSFKLRLNELKKLGIKILELSGPTILNGTPILGKGTRGIAVKAFSQDYEYALKIRRLDSPRRNLLNEVKIQSYVNSFGIGPKIVNYSNNFIVMELIQGKLLSDLYLMKSLNTNILRTIIKSLLYQCYRLDLNGVDHGELSDLRKHVIINNRVNIIDFDSASINRKTSNLTSCIQYLFIGGPNSKLFSKLFDIDLDKLILLLRKYKLNKDFLTFLHLLKFVNMY
jgi:putative serine/threonine protein kinase